MRGRPVILWDPPARLFRKPRPPTSPRPRTGGSLDHGPSRSAPDSISICPRSTRLSSISVRKRLGSVKTVGPRPPRAMVSGISQRQLVHGPGDRHVEDAPFFVFATWLVERAPVREAILDDTRNENVRPLEALGLVNRGENQNLAGLVACGRVHSIHVAGQQQVGDQSLEAIVLGGQAGRTVRCRRCGCRAVRTTA